MVAIVLALPFVSMARVPVGDVCTQRATAVILVSTIASVVTLSGLFAILGVG